MILQAYKIILQVVTVYGWYSWYCAPQKHVTIALKPTDLNIDKGKQETIFWIIKISGQLPQMLSTHGPLQISS